MGRGAREVVLDGIKNLGTKIGVEQSMNVHVLHWPTPQESMAQIDDNCWGRLLLAIGFSGHFSCVEKRLKVHSRKQNTFQAHF